MNKEQLICIKKLSNNECLYNFFVLSIWNWSIKRREKKKNACEKPKRTLEDSNFTGRAYHTVAADREYRKYGHTYVVG